MFEFTKEIINNLLDLEDYHKFFEKVSTQKDIEAPYDDEDLLLYTIANFKRSNKIRTKVNLDKKLYNELNSGTDTWTWILITEPWCGDASFTQPIIEAVCLAGNIDLKIALRDKEKSMMNAYLTDKGKSIPKLIVLDEHLMEIFQWGPRPKELQAKIKNLLNNNGLYDEKLKLAHQWYRKYGSEALQQELLELIKKNKHSER